MRQGLFLGTLFTLAFGVTLALKWPAQRAPDFTPGPAPPPAFVLASASPSAAMQTTTPEPEVAPVEPSPPPELDARMAVAELVANEDEDIRSEALALRDALDTESER
jgi:hypothetical protein